MDNQDTWLKKAQTAWDMIDRASLKLSGIAYDLSAVGLDRPADRIEAVIADLDTAIDLIKKSTDQNLNEGLARAQESSGMLLKAILAGAFSDGKD